MGRRPRSEMEKANGEEPAAKLGRYASMLDLALPEASSLSGNLLSCGQGEVGQLGLGEDVYEKTRPALNADIKDVVEISAGGMHNLCLTKNGDVYSFGCNDEGALGRETADEGSEFVPKKIELPAKCVKISAGDSHSACLLKDGRVFAWGSFRDSHGNMGLTLEGNKRKPIEVIPTVKSVDIASGGDHLVILTSHGLLYTVGCAEQGQLGRVSFREASGESRRGKTQLLQPDIVTSRGKKLVGDAIWASTYCTYFRQKSTSKIYAFGLNNYNQLGLGPKFETTPFFNPKLSTFTDVKSIAGGQHHTLVLRNDNKVYAIGRKEYGRLGLGNVTEDAVELTLVEALKDHKIVEISCGESTSFAITDKGEVYAWGMGSNQQLGTGKEDDEFTPVLVTGVQVKGKNVLKVSSGGQHSLFIVEDKPIDMNGNSSSVKAATKKTAKPAEKAIEKIEEVMDEEEVSSSEAPQEDAVSSTVELNGDTDEKEEKASKEEKKKAAAKGRKRKN